jgi:uncharacterized protein YaiE (UPF0345 family)
MANLSEKVTPSGLATGAQGDLADTAVQPNTPATLGDTTFNGSVKEAEATLTGTAPEIDPANGTIQTWSLTGASNPTFAAGWDSGESVLVMVKDTSDFGIASWPTMNWIGGAVPVLDPTATYSGVTVVKIGADFFGASAGDFK